MALVGFARVSTREQDLSEQIKQLKQAGCEKIFEGKNSGKKESNADRLSELRNWIRDGDIVVVTKLDRLGRSLKQVLEVLDDFQQRNIGFKTLDGAIDTTKRNDPIAMAMIQLLGLFSELERNFIVTRTQEGKLARGKAGKGGRPKALSDSDLIEFKEDTKNQLTIEKLSMKYNISLSSARRYRQQVLEQLETENINKMSDIEREIYKLEKNIKYTLKKLHYVQKIMKFDQYILSETLNLINQRTGVNVREIVSEKIRFFDNDELKKDFILNLENYKSYIYKLNKLR